MGEKALALEYNSNRPDLVFSEYGRHVQKLIKHAKDIENKDLRQAYVEEVVELMHQMNPQSKNVADHIDRLWSHIFRIAEYDLDVVPPNGKAPTEPAIDSTQLKLKYPQNEFNHRHYGHNVQVLIEKAKNVEDEEKRREFTRSIAAYMKLAYKMYGHENHVNDEVIKNDIAHLSGNALELSDDYNINNLKNVSSRKRSNNHHRRGRKSRGNNKRR